MDRRRFYPSACIWGRLTNIREELALIIEEFLNQRILGFKNEAGVYITPAFPKLLYILEEDNIREDSKYWYLTVLAAKCTAKRMVPDYISEKIMKQLKVNEKGSKRMLSLHGLPFLLTPDRTMSLGNIAHAKITLRVRANITAGLTKGL